MQRTRSQECSEETQRGDGGERGGDAAEYMQELLCKEYITDMTLDVFRSGFFCQVAGNNVTQFFAAAPSSKYPAAGGTSCPICISGHNHLASPAGCFVVQLECPVYYLSACAPGTSQSSTVYSLQVKSCVPV